MSGHGQAGRGAAAAGQALRDHKLLAEIRIKGRPDPELAGTAMLEDIRPAGDENLPSQAMAIAAGGSTPTDMTSQEGAAKALDPMFEVRVRPALEAHPSGMPTIQPGQRVVVRFHLEQKPLLVQWKRAILQLIQRRGL